MIGSLATMGYACKKPDWSWELAAATRVNSQLLIVDTRLSPRCTWSGLWQRGVLEHTWGTRYIWKGELLGNINYRHPDQGIQLADPDQGIPWVIGCLERGQTLLLLCGCADYLHCHRKVIYDLVKARMGDRLPEYWPGQRVLTAHGPGTIDPMIPVEIHRARNRYAVILDRYHPQRAFFPQELQPYEVVQQKLTA